MIKVREVHKYEPSALELFFANPTNIVLLGILVVGAIGLAVLFKNKRSNESDDNGK